MAVQTIGARPLRSGLLAVITSALFWCLSGCSSTLPPTEAFTARQTKDDETAEPKEYLDAFDAEIFRLTHTISGSPPRAQPRLSHTAAELKPLQSTLSEFTTGILGEAGLPSLPRVELVSRGRVALETTPDRRMLIDVATLRVLVDHLAVKYYGSIDAYADMLKRAERNDLTLNTGADAAGIEVAKIERTNPREWPVFVKQSFMTSSTMFGLIYMILHEAAHVEMKHHQRLAAASASSRCSVLREAEVEADDFAVRTMTTKLLKHYGMFIDPRLRAQSGAHDQDFSDMLQGFHLAFSDIRELHSGTTAIAGCTYPSREERLARTMSAADAILLSRSSTVDARPTKRTRPR